MLKRSPAAREAGTNREKGQALLEFSLVIGFLLLTMFAIIDFSRVFFSYATMSNGVREGARYGIVHPGQDTAILDHAREMMIVIGAEPIVTVDYPDEVADPNDPSGGTYNFCSHLCRVVVRAECDFDVWTPIIPTFQIVTTATMHIE
jgi:hypothetical protein